MTREKRKERNDQRVRKSGAHAQRYSWYNIKY
jgi:hypothetical protein